MGRKLVPEKTGSTTDATESTLISGSAGVSNFTGPEPSEEQQNESGEENADQGEDAVVAEDTGKSHGVEKVAGEEKVEEKPVVKRRNSTRISKLSKKRAPLGCHLPSRIETCSQLLPLIQ